MTEPVSEEVSVQFRRLLDECRRLYVSSGELCLREYPDLVPQCETGFATLMDDLHRALVVKVFVTICEADRNWSVNERALARELVTHLWGAVPEDGLKQIVQEMSAKAMSLKWYALVRPFDQIAPLRDRVGELETIVTRLAHLVARVDGPVSKSELDCVKMIQDELYLHLRQIPIDEPDQHEAAVEARVTAVKKMIRDAKAAPQASGKRVAIDTAEETAPKVDSRPPEERLQEALAELEGLIGLANIKEEIRTLTNFLKVQSQRQQSGLPSTELSLHIVFSGNPGTGKTTVARILGKIFGSMGILKQGHLVETDRSGLVAGYAGQTSLKANEKIDEALDGVLFIDEAYSLVAADAEDQYGDEAIQALLKRMEDERDRLVVVLAGYPDEMKQLLHSNPGLSSRFSRNLDFPDYSPLELAKIFGLMCEKNHYTLEPMTRAKVLLALNHAHRLRDRHFGNGRTVRNMFEHVIRRMANRIVAISDLSVDQLTTLEPEDIAFSDIPAEAFALLDQGDSLRFVIRCVHCQHAKDVPHSYLGQKVRCPKCQKDFAADWGELEARQSSA